MRLPYLQVSQEFLTAQAPEIAVRAKTDLPTVIGAGILLFAHAVERTSTDESPPDGIFAEKDAEEVLEGIMRWGGEPGRLIEAFVRARVIERLKLGVRVRGLDRYAKAWEEAEKARERKERWKEEQERRKNVFGTRSNTVPPASGTPINADAEAEPTQKEPPPPAGGSTRDRLAVVVGETETASLFEAMQAQREEEGFQREARQPKGFRDWHLEFRRVGHQDYQALRGHRDFLRDKSIRRPGHPTGVFIHPEVWPLRTPPPELPPEPRVRPGRPPPQEPAPAAAAAAWNEMLSALREEGKTYALEWLQRLTPLSLVEPADAATLAEDTVLTLEAPDEFFLAWVQDHYGEWLVRLGRERSLAVQLRTPGPAPPVPAGVTLAQQVQAEDERHRLTGEVLQLVREVAGGGS